jgi:hypothetical protein
MPGAKLGLGILLVLGAFLPCEAGEPHEKTHVICDPTDPENGCPDGDCICIPDTLELVFDAGSESTYEYDEFAEGMEIPFTVVTETVTPWVQGWSYGVAHDKDSLGVTALTVEGTEAEVSINMGFVSLDFESVQTCGDDPSCDSANRTEGGGWISAIVYKFKVVHNGLPIQRNAIARGTYKLLKDVGPDGTLIRFTDRLAYNGSPPTSLSMTVYGKSRLWTTAVDGWVMRNDAPEGLDFLRGDVGLLDGSVLPADGDLNILDPVRVVWVLFSGMNLSFSCERAADADDSGAVSVTDAIFLANYLFRAGPAPPPPFGMVGPDVTQDSLPCRGYP